MITRTRKEVYELWLKALRSGEYKQTTGTLRDDDGFCCLGVLCDLARKDGGPSWDGQIFDGSRNILSDRIRDFMGFRSWMEPKGKPEQQDLSSRNDDGKSFDEIANYIEYTVMPAVCEG